MGEQKPGRLKLIGLFISTLAALVFLFLGLPQPVTAATAVPAASGTKAATATPAAAKTAQYVPNVVCKACHKEEYERFSQTPMGHLFMLHPRNDLEKLGCQGCHGPGSLHAESGGKKVGGMLTFNKKLDPDVQLEAKKCLECHNNGQRVFWNASVMAFRGVTCTDCHYVMRDISPRYNLRAARVVTPFEIIQPQTEVCLRCHLRKRMQINLMSHMPISEGLMQCTDCHNPHGGPYPHQLRAATVNEVCYKCHTERRGPFLWTHPPVATDCLNCHTPHGSVNRFLLKMPEPRLCQQCHIGSFHPGEPQGANTPFVFNRACTNCHSHIHGSNSPGGVYFTR